MARRDLTRISHGFIKLTDPYKGHEMVGYELFIDEPELRRRLLRKAVKSTRGSSALGGGTVILRLVDQHTGCALRQKDGG